MPARALAAGSLRCRQLPPPARRPATWVGTRPATVGAGRGRGEPVLQRPGMTTSTLSVKGMTCGACARRVEKAVKGLDGVQQVAVDLAQGQVSVEHDEQRSGRASVAEAIRKSGYEVTG